MNISIGADSPESLLDTAGVKCGLLADSQRQSKPQLMEHRRNTFPDEASMMLLSHLMCFRHYREPVALNRQAAYRFFSALAWIQ
jgi:hypothetical protein